MPSTNFPLRWESTGDQWWFASPIDWAAANGHYDVVRELLHIDTNLLIKLTSLPRLRRLETVWDDGHQGFRNVARCRALVAYKLLQECETGRGGNSLIRAGYGGWLLYTAAAAGDAVFVKELLDREPCLVFGEGEYGVTDVLYAAARSRNGEVFRMLFECSLSPRGSVKEVSPAFRLEMVNRAVHAAARGGNVEMLKELLGENGDALSYRDRQGSTVLHSAAGRGQVEVVRYLISTYNIVYAVDSQGNTALQVAAFRGHPAVVEALVSALPCLASMANSYGDTVLHMAVSGFCAPNFRRIDRQRELMKLLVDGKLMNVEDVINFQNKVGRTALHLAVIGSVQSDIVELLMSVRYIDYNLRDADGNTPLDLLKQRPRSASSEILIKRLISAGGMSDCRDHTVRKALVSHLKTHGIGGSPGTSFLIPDAEIFLHAGDEDPGMHSGDITSSEYGYSGEINQIGSTAVTDSPRFDKLRSINRTNLRLKTLFNKWHRKKDKSTTDAPDLGDSSSSIDSYISSSGLSSKNRPLSLRKQFSRASSLPNNKRVSSFPYNLPSPSTRRKFAAGLSQGVLQVTPKPHKQSPSSPLSESAWSSPVPNNNSNGVHDRSGSAGPSPSPKKSRLGQKHRSFNMRVINDYLCFGSHGQRVKKLMGSPPRSREGESSVDGE